MNYKIEKCEICQLNIKDLAKKYGGCGIYYPKVLKIHLQKDHNIDFHDYFIQYCNFEEKECPCNICNKKLKIIAKGSKILYSKYACGRNPGVLKWSEEAKEKRKGLNNPMFNKQPWNLGLTAKTNKSLAESARKNTNKIVSKETKEKQSISAKKRKIHGHTGKKHSNETKEKLRKNTLRLIALGAFKQTKSQCHLKFKELLIKNNILFEEEKIVSYWSFDFYLYEHNVYIEIDGDYWHSNPRRYKNGPQSKTQKINYARDISKNNFCKKNNLTLIRFWEYDVLNNEKEIICKLKKLLELKN